MRGLGAWQSWLDRLWWRPGPAPSARLLKPLTALYVSLARRHAARQRARQWRAPCPVVVVGNLVVGGAGKTPCVIALCDLLQQAGWRPGVVSRGHGRADPGAVLEVTPAADARLTGDEPLLIRRRTACPVFVGADRVKAAQALLDAYPATSILLADDGLQHLALARDLECWLFDERGLGNGQLLPAGPLRQPLPERVPQHAIVLYNAARPSTPLPGHCLQRALSGAQPLHEWQRQRALGTPPALAALDALRGTRPLAIAGIAAPQRFFAMLRAHGIDCEPLPLADHADFDRLPWPPATELVVCTEKDAVKLDPARLGGTQVWVVGLDLRLPSNVASLLHRRLGPPPGPP